LEEIKYLRFFIPNLCISKDGIKFLKLICDKGIQGEQGIQGEVGKNILYK
jgi:hypothetical protein